MKYVGIDLHKQTISGCVMVKERGRKKLFSRKRLECRRGGHRRVAGGARPVFGCAKSTRRARVGAKKAIVAIARPLLGVIYSLLQYNQKYSRALEAT